MLHRPPKPDIPLPFPGPSSALRNAALVVAVCAPAAGCTEVVVRDNPDPAGPEVEVTETFRQLDRPRVDLLFVVDNTPSMETVRADLADAATRLISALDAGQLAWQVGVVSTDVESDATGLLHGDPWIITPSTASGPAAIARALDVPIGSAPTGGLGAATRALTEPLRSGENRGFRRPDAALHIVVLSDADDESTAVLGIDPADAFLEFLDDEATASAQPATLSAVVGDLGTGCVGSTGTALPGDTYIAVAEASGGAVISICEADLGAVIASLGTLVQEGTTRFELQAVPVPETVRVDIDGVRRDADWTLFLTPPAVVMDTPPPPGSTLSVRYTIARSELE